MARSEAKWKRKTLKHLQDTSVIENARVMCHLTAENILKAARSNRTHPKFAVTGNLSIVDDNSSAVSEANNSIVRALRRGSRRGARESADDTLSRTALTVAEDTAASTSSSLRRKRKKLPPPFRGKPYTRKRNPTHDVWMCGVCGKAYASLESTTKHERKHILDVVERLGNWPSNRGAMQASIFESAQMRVTTGSEPSPWLDPDAKLPSQSTPVLIPRWTSTQRLNDLEIDELLGGPVAYHPDDDDEILLPHDVRDYGVHADQALVDVTKQAVQISPWISEQERAMEMELLYLARDAQYYDMLAERRQYRQNKPGGRYRTESTNLAGKVQNKFVDAYQIMKESKGQSSGLKDQYTLNAKESKGNSEMIDHNSTTLYVNVMVKNSIQVVRHELERLARQRWEEMDNTGGAFDRFRIIAHENFVKLAGLALQSDFTPRRIAVQLSNDLYRLLTPRLKRRGVTIETEIEYRVGPYFVLATNVTRIDWGKLIKATNKDYLARRAGWAAKKKADEDEGPHENLSKLERVKAYFMSIYQMTMVDVIARVLAWMHYVHWTIYFPICWLAWRTTMLGNAIRQFVLSSVTDEIFNYIEEKGMAMEIEIRSAPTQAAFMLSALREIRADGRELKKKQKESESAGKGEIIGPLLGPAIKTDKRPVPKPNGFEVPENLDFVGLEVDLPVGFRRLRWALLAADSTFVTEGLYRHEARYDSITWGEWDKCNEYIGQTNLPDSVDPSDFAGAQKKASYLMPKSAFVKANMCYEIHKIEVYNDYCFCFKKQARNPDAPFGSTFVAWTQFVIINNGDGTCKLTCSVEPEFPNGPPLVRKQITSGMRAGVGELFVLIGETISKYAEEYP